MEPKNRLREIFSAIGLEVVRPSNQLLNNKGRVSITAAEGKSLEK